MTAYQFRDDFWHDRMLDEVKRCGERLKKMRVRYTNDPRSILEKRVPFRKPYYFSSGSQSSLVVT